LDRQDVAQPDLLQVRELEPSHSPSGIRQCIRHGILIAILGSVRQCAYPHAVQDDQDDTFYAVHAFLFLGKMM
jgi:hypothetical protein